MRKHFQSVKNKFDNSIVLFDNASTVQLPDATIKAMSDFYYNENFPANGASYRQSEQSIAKITRCKEKVLQFLGTDDSRYQVIFCKNASDGFQALINSFELGRGLGDVLITNLEHNSVYKALLTHCNKNKLTLDQLDILNSSDQELLDMCSEDRFTFACLTMSSNIVGPVWDSDLSDLKSYINSLRWDGCIVALDACQIIGHKKIDLNYLDPNILFFSGHKFGGPHGIGVLVVKNYNSFLPKLKQELEIGSNAMAQIVGLEATIDFYNQNVDFKAVEQNTKTLVDSLVAFLKGFEFIELVAGRAGQVGQGSIVSFIPRGIPLHDFSWVLAENGVLTRSGTMCAELACKSLKIDGCIRISLFGYNNTDDLELFYKAFAKTVDFFKGKL